MQQAAAEKAQQAAAAQIAQGQALALQQLWGAQPQQIAALQGGQEQALAALKASKDASLGYYNQALPLYEPYRQQGLDAWKQYGNAAGLNGQAGYDAATGAFRASPNYQYDLQQASDETQRAAGAVGELYSGNTAAAISDRAGKMADREYGNYVDRLRDIAGTGYNATGAEAGLYQGMAGVEGNYGAAAGGLYDSTGARLAGVIGGTADKAADTYNNAAMAQAQSLSNLGKQTIDAYGFGQASKDRADTNNLNLGIAGLNAAATLGGAAIAGPAGGAGASALTAALTNYLKNKSGGY
jgi:hypothetical protein